MIKVYHVCMSKQTAYPDLLDPEYWGGTIKMSLSKFFILCVLCDNSLHGYDIAKEVEKVTDGCCSPREGTIYPILKQFAEGGYVTCVTEVFSGRERKIYTITDKGRVAFRVGLGEWMKITKSLESCEPIVMENS